MKKFESGFDRMASELRNRIFRDLEANLASADSLATELTTDVDQSVSESQKSFATYVMDMTLQLERGIIQRNHEIQGILTKVEKH